MFAAVTSRLSRWNVAVGIYAIVAFAALAPLLLAPGTIGHHWDWMIPADPSELRRFALTDGSAWQDYDFGSYVTYRYATVLTSLLFGLPGFLGLNGAFVTKSLVVVSVFVSAIGMRYLLLSLTRDDADPRDGTFATLGGLLYALAPYAYNQIVSGDQSALISDALSPIAIGLAVRCIAPNERRWLAQALGAALLLGIIVASAQVFVFTVGVMWAIGLAIAWSKTTAVRLGVVTAVGIALCSFWLLPAMLAGGAVHTVVQTSPIDTAIATFGQFSNPLLTVTMLAFPGDFYLHAIDRGAAFFFAAYGLLLAAIVTALVTRRTRLLIVLGVLFLLTAIVPLGGNRIVGPAIIAVFRALLPYSLFLRTPQHLMFVMALVLPAMVYLAVRKVPPRFTAACVGAGVLVIAAYAQGFFVHGNYFGLIGPFGESRGERAAVAQAAATGDEYRTLFVPNSPSFYFHPGIFDYYFEGSDDPQVRFLPGMSLGAGQKWTPYDRTQQLVKSLDELVPDGADPRTQAMLLEMSGVARIVVHHIGTPTAGIRLKSNSDRRYLESALRATRLATLVGSYDDRSTWRFNAPVARAYAPDCVFGVPPVADPYDVLALAPAAASCARPATVATGVAAARSEQIVTPESFRPDSSRGLVLGLQPSDANVESLDGGRAFYADVPPRVQDVEIFELPPHPAGATGIALRMYSTAPRRVYVQLYAPDELNFLQATVDFSGAVQDVALNFSDFGGVGRPDLATFRYVRLASVNTQKGDVRMYVGSVRWLYGAAHTRVPQYLTVSGDRFDGPYFGGNRDRVIFKPTPSRAPVFARVSIAHAGTYDVVARVQDVRRNLSLRALVDGAPGRCSPAGGRIDQTQRLIRLARVPLRGGVHAIGLQYCNDPPQGKIAIGVQSLIVAAAAFQAPAFRAGGTVGVASAGPGTMRLNATGNYLVFTDSFDDRWKATQNGAALPHAIANGYANVWRVADPSAGDVVLEFWPQRSFEFGIAVSLGLAAACLVVIAATLLEPRGARAPVAERITTA